MSDGLKSFLFAVAMCVVCSTLLTLSATGLKRFQEQNILLDRRKNILSAARLLHGDGAYTFGDIQQIYSENITPLWVDADGNVKESGDRSPGDLPLYLCNEDGSLVAYVIPFSSRGLWGKIHGYLALEKDGATVRGFTVYSHQETPGLGGEIEKRWFQKNFSGKKIIDRQGEFVSVAVAKGRVAETVPETRQSNYVDGISGATLTGKFLSEGLKGILLDYEPVSVQFRGNRMTALPDEGDS